MQVKIGGLLLARLTNRQFFHEWFKFTDKVVSFADGTELYMTAGDNFIFAISEADSGASGSHGALLIVVGAKFRDEDGVTGKTLQKIRLGMEGEGLLIEDINYTVESVPEWVTFVIELRGEDFEAGGGY